MPLTIYDWIYGSGQIGAVILSIIAGIIAISMFKQARKRKLLQAWKYLIPALVLFAFEEIFGALRTFGVYSNPWITHVIPSFILAFLIASLVVQIQINKGCA